MHGIENFPCAIIDPTTPDAAPEWVGGAHELIASNEDGEGDVESLVEALATLKAPGDKALCGFVQIVRFSL